MKVIFLDIDGVLNINGTFSAAACKNLNLLLDKVPDVEIVISSHMRYNGLKFCKDTLENQGIDPEKVIDITDVKHTSNRGIHIEKYVEKHELKHFVILDDRSDMDKVLDHLVQINSFIGITEADVNKALDILNKP